MCQKLKEGVVLRSYNLKLCYDCFVKFFLKRTKETIEKFKMFSEKDKVLVAISGGKDSMALAKALKMLNFNIVLCHINVGVEKENYSFLSQQKVEKFAKEENLDLKVLSFKKEIGATVEEASRVLKKEICAVCGMIKRYLLNREAKDFDVVVTGHNLTDEAGTLLSSLIFWKEEYLKKQFPILESEGSLKRKAKPFCLISEKETQIFCNILKLDYQKTPCPLRGGSYVFFKKIVNQIENEMPSALLNFYKTFLKRKTKWGWKRSEISLRKCSRCGYQTVTDICNFCRLKEKINKLKDENISSEN